MAAYRRVYNSRHLQADCQEPGSAPEPYAQQSIMGYLYFLLSRLHRRVHRAASHFNGVTKGEQTGTT